MYNENINKLNTEERTKIIAALVEGNSIRATCRMTGAAKGTVIKLLESVGKVCADYQNEHLRNLNCKLIQIDEIWSFCYAKQKNVSEDKQEQFGYGDIWTFTAIDAEAKLVPSWLVGSRDASCASEFLDDLKDRLANRVQITSDGHRIYLNAVEEAFGYNVDYAMLIKLYGQSEPENEKRYSSSDCISTEKYKVHGNPDPDKISASYVERQNLTMRMNMRRFTRLTNGFSKKVENLEHAVALHFMYYNFARPHKSLANPYPRTPAMAAGIENHVWKIEDIIKLIDSN